MIQNYKPAERKEQITFSRDFDYKGQGRHCGFSFPCDETGKIDPSLSPDALANLAFCLNDNGEKLVDRGVIRNVYRYTDPASGTCRCGTEVELDGDGCCDNCGQWYNISGQELLPPHRWGEPEGYDDDVAVYVPW